MRKYYKYCDKIIKILNWIEIKWILTILILVAIIEYIFKKILYFLSIFIKVGMDYIERMEKRNEGN